jgi:hypothetical protein
MSKDPNEACLVGPSAEKSQIERARSREQRKATRSETKEAEAKLKQRRGTAN